MTSLASHVLVDPQVRRTQLLRPVPVSQMLDRARLRAHLDQGDGIPLTLVTAPAGFGKTTLVSSWIGTVSQPCAWVSIDPADAHLATLIAKLVAAIGTIAPFVGPRSLMMLAEPDETAPAALAAIFADELLALDEFVLVLDDFHLAGHSRAVNEFVDVLISFPPPQLRIVLTSRSAPSLPLARLRAQGRLLEIDSADLAFTEEEAREFLGRVLAVEPASKFVDRVVRMAEGWPTMLHLAALVASRSGVDVDDSQLLSAAHRHAVAYLGLNLMDSLTSEQRAFLYRIALPEQVSAALAEALSDDLPHTQSAAQLLESISADGFFLTPLGGDRAWYRFHSIFRTFLLDRLGEELGSGGVRSLHLRAAAWFEQHGHIDAAIEHALQAGDDGLASRIVIDHAQLAIAGDQWREFDRWLRLLPGSAFQSSVDLVLIRGWIHQISGRYDLLNSTTMDASAMLAAIPETDPAHEMRRAELDLLGMHLNMPSLASVQDRIAVERIYTVLMGTDHYAELVAIHLLGEQLAVQDHEAGKVFLEGIVSRDAERRDQFARFRVLTARSAHAMLAASEGNYQLIGDLGHQIVHGADEASTKRMRAHGDVFAGGYHLEQGELDQAEIHLRRVATNPYAGIIVRVSGVTMLARCLTAGGRPREAQELIERLLDEFLESDIVRFLPVLRTCQAHLALLRDDTSEASRLIHQVMDNIDPAINRGSKGSTLLAAAIMLAANRADDEQDIERILATLSGRPEYLTSRTLELDVLLLHAVLDRRQDNDEAARSHVRRALDVAEGGGYLWSLAELGAPVIDLLCWYRDTGGQSRLLDALPLDVLAGRVPFRSTPSAEAAPVDPESDAEQRCEELTFRELDVLSGLHRRLSNKEIADELSISPLTVKSHARSIYGKLGVNGRRQATARATTLGLIG